MSIEDYDPQDDEYAPLFEKYVLVQLSDTQYVDKHREGGNKSE